MQEYNSYKFTAESLKKKFRLSEFLAEKLISGVAFVSIAIIILIFIFVFRESMPAFTAKDHKVLPKGNTEVSSLKPESYGSDEPASTPDPAQAAPERYGVDESQAPSDHNSASQETTGDEGSLSSLWSLDWFPVSMNPRFGLIPLFVGTLKVTLLAILFAAPIAIMAALFSSAFAPSWLREWIKPAIELLAGFPSVVVGFFALMIMATFLQDVFGYETRLNAFVGGVAMALAAIPIIFTITEDALTSVPATYKEASLALGASKWQTALFVTLPAATPGIFAAVLLGIGRVFGETMIALMATGNAALTSLNPFESVRTLAATIGAEMAEVVFGDMHYGVLFLIGSLLFIFTFTLNAVAEFYIKGKLVRKIQGK
jgi:phosphate transport system permease protein